MHACAHVQYVEAKLMRKPAQRMNASIMLHTNRLKCNVKVPFNCVGVSVRNG